jgi:hypothetical protein
MAEHGDNYKRMTGPKGEEIGSLGKECGHHCIVQTVGHAHQSVRHCDCKECHDSVGTIMHAMLPSQFTMQSGGVDPRGIS